jgi:hypothetical protein
MDEIISKLVPASDSRSSPLEELKFAEAAVSTTQKAIALWDEWRNDNKLASKMLAIVLAKKIPAEYRSALPDALVEML